MTNFQKLVSHMSHALSVPLLATYCNKKENIFNSTTKSKEDRISRKKTQPSLTNNDFRKNLELQHKHATCYSSNLT